MAEYIDRNELVKNLDRFAPEHLTPLIRSLIEKHPTADVVEVPKWIDVKERLPEPNEKDESDYFMKAYLVARCNGFTMHTALWNGENWILWTKGTVLKDITHWMPLPGPPEQP